jgi:hypothetical protein
MAQAQRPADEGGAEFVRRIVTDPTNVPDVMRLYGYPGPSSEEGHDRLYLTPDLSSYVEVPRDAILHRMTVPPERDPNGAVVLWVRRNATLIHKMTPAAQELAQFFAGPIAAATGAAAGAAAVPLPTILPQACPITLPVQCTPACPTHIPVHCTPACPTHLPVQCTPACPTHVPVQCTPACPTYIPVQCTPACPTHVPVQCTPACPTYIPVQCTPACPTYIPVQCTPARVTAAACPPLRPTPTLMPSQCYDDGLCAFYPRRSL